MLVNVKVREYSRNGNSVIIPSCNLLRAYQSYLDPRFQSESFGLVLRSYSEMRKAGSQIYASRPLLLAQERTDSTFEEIPVMYVTYSLTQLWYPYK